MSELKQSHSDHIRQTWDMGYAEGKYVFEGPVGFTSDIINFTREHLPPDARGLYVGCGNGRNFVPMVEAGLDIDGIDLSPEGIDQIRQKLPADFKGRLEVGDFHDLQGQWDYLAAMQVFQFGDSSKSKAHFARAAQLIRPGGYLFLRAPSVATNIDLPHELLEGKEAGPRTVKYSHANIYHYFDEQELSDLAATNDFQIVVPAREERIVRESPRSGHWDYLDTIWQRN